MGNISINKREKVSDLDIVIKWLKVRKDHLKSKLIDKFIEDIDYKITKPYKNTLRSKHEKILITPDCFKALCMLTPTKVGDQVRIYRKYALQIRDSLYSRIGVLEHNQKPRLNIKGGVIYVYKTPDSSFTRPLYKIGKISNINHNIKVF